MKKVRIELENCYGIRKLSTELDFSKKRTVAIYAPNGAMKSSLAETFRDVAAGKQSKDRVFPNRRSLRMIEDEDGGPLPSETIMVIRSYDEMLGCTEETATLLVDQQLRAEYESLHASLNRLKKEFLDALKEQSGSRRDFEAEISEAFTDQTGCFFAALSRVRNEVNRPEPGPLAGIHYDTIFNEKVLGVLATKNFRLAIAAYVERYNQLLDASTYFRRGVFNYYNASQIAKTLDANGFFSAAHSVNLNAERCLEIKDAKALEQLIEEELKGIASDTELQRTFADLKKYLERNKELREFQAYISSREYLLSYLANPDVLKQNVLTSYFAARLNVFNRLLDEHERVAQRSKEIEQKARTQRTQWQNAIDIFNRRFFVPFKLHAVNQVAVMLGSEAMLSLGFTFDDGTESTDLAHDDLMRVLSTGEKKALYILNIVFEIEVRKKARKRTLFVVDDIADSFDYKNKYAIIQYLKDISEEPFFYQVILTHNFDFYRTIQSRSLVAYSSCLMAAKTERGIQLSQAEGIKNPFVLDWKPKFNSDDKKKVACIPFMRNLVEYTRGSGAGHYLTLTSLLHWKKESGTVTEEDLCVIYRELFGDDTLKKASTRPVVSIIDNAAEECLAERDSMNLEHKVVLSIATRLRAERFMLARINDESILATLGVNQTQQLLREFKTRFPDDPVTAILDMVVLMTPENIHLNSFMYEPILDMSSDHLKKLYRDVCSLK